MRNRTRISKPSAVAIAVLVSSLALGAAVFAKSAREFAGTFKVLEAKNQGGNVQVRLSLRLRNYSPADVKNATISFESSLARTEKQVAIQGVNLRVNERQVLPPLEATLTISAAEYATWQNGARPNLYIDFQDAVGGHNHQAIELIRMP
jgi:hypothetical protein